MRALILASLLGLAACQTSGGSFCDVSRPHVFQPGEVNTLTDERVEELLAHNEKGTKLCNWKPQAYFQ